MADEVQGLIVLTEGDRFVTIGRAGRARVWRIDLTGEAVEDVDRTGVAPDATDLFKGWGWERDDDVLRWNGTLVCDEHHPVQHRDGRPPWCKKCGRLAGGLPHEEYVGGALHAPEREGFGG